MKTLRPLYSSGWLFVTRGTRVARVAAAAFALTLAGGHARSTAAMQALQTEPAELLAALGFDEGDLRALGRGDVISRGLDTHASGEIAVAGAVLVKVPRTYFVERLWDIVEFKQGERVLEIGAFSDRPEPPELEGLTLTPDDLKSLERCRENDCELKLPAAAIATFREHVEWRAPDAAEQATGAFKAMLIDRTVQFLDGGPSAIEPYADGHSKPFDVEVGSLLEASAELFRHAPEFQQSLGRAPRDAGPDVQALTYWSKEKAAFKPLISLTHMSVYTTPAAGTTMTYGASMNFYSSHYLDASIGATVAVERMGEPEAAVYVVYVNRSRVDALNGLFSGLRRWGVQREARGGLKDQLESARRRLEAGYASRP